MSVKKYSESSYPLVRFRFKVKIFNKNKIKTV